MFKRRIKRRILGVWMDIQIWDIMIHGVKDLPTNYTLKKRNKRTKILGYPESGGKERLLLIRF